MLTKWPLHPFHWWLAKSYRWNLLVQPWPLVEAGEVGMHRVLAGLSDLKANTQAVLPPTSDLSDLDLPGSSQGGKNVNRASGLL